jgi:hypothetical protein
LMVLRGVISITTNRPPGLKASRDMLQHRCGVRDTPNKRPSRELQLSHPKYTGSTLLLTVRART